jgi:hypothetical protein
MHVSTSIPNEFRDRQITEVVKGTLIRAESFSACSASVGEVSPSICLKVDNNGAEN